VQIYLQLYEKGLKNSFAISENCSIAIIDGYFSDTVNIRDISQEIVMNACGSFLFQCVVNQPKR
jgi:hypothetical protein